MDSSIIFIRHAHTEPNFTIIPREWQLSVQGLKQRLKLLEQSNCQEFDVIYCSSEKKAIQTATPLAQYLHLPLEIDRDLDEVRSTQLPLRIQSDYLRTKRNAFSNLSFISPNSEGNESYAEALQRFNNCIFRIQNAHHLQKIGVVSHGTILTLYLAYLEKKLDEWRWMYEKWIQFPFLGIIIVQDDQIVKYPWL